MNNDDAEHLTQLLRPDFAAVERHFGHPVPEALRRLYSDAQELARPPFRVVVERAGSEPSGIFVQTYTPIDHNTLLPFAGFERFIEFADNGSGDVMYFIDPTESDPEVCVYVMDGPCGLPHTLYPQGFTLSEFLAVPRLPPDSPVA